MNASVHPNASIKFSMTRDSISDDLDLPSSLDQIKCGVLNTVMDPKAEDDDGVSVLELLEPLQDLRGEHVELELLVDFDVLGRPLLLDLLESLSEEGFVVLGDKKRNVEDLSELATESCGVDNHRDVEGPWGISLLDVALKEDSLLWVNLSDFFLGGHFVVLSLIFLF